MKQDISKIDDEEFTKILLTKKPEKIEFYGRLELTLKLKNFIERYLKINPNFTLDLSEVENFTQAPKAENMYSKFFSGLKNLVLGKNFKSFEPNDFYGINVSISDDNPDFIVQDGLILSRDKTILYGATVLPKKEKKEAAVLPEELKTIKSGALNHYGIEVVFNGSKIFAEKDALYSMGSRNYYSMQKVDAPKFSGEKNEIKYCVKGKQNFLDWCLTNRKDELCSMRYCDVLYYFSNEDEKIDPLYFFESTAISDLKDEMESIRNEDLKNSAKVSSVYQMKNIFSSVKYADLKKSVLENSNDDFYVQVIKVSNTKAKIIRTKKDFSERTVEEVEIS